MSQGTISSDGLFYWDGAQWQPTRSPDGMWRWTGSAWVASSDAGVTLQSVSGYSSPRWIGVWLSVLLGVSVAMALIAFLGELYFNLMLTLAGRDIVYSIDVGGLFIFAITSTVFLVWFGLSYRNLSFLGARDLLFTPGRAVGWWFVPVACWWKPYAALVEIWQASDPTAPATTSAPSRRGADSVPLLPFWWATWIISLVLVNAASLLIYPADTQQWLLNMSAAATAVAGVLAMVVVLSISSRQDARWRRLVSQTSASA